MNVFILTFNLKCPYLSGHSDIQQLCTLHYFIRCTPSLAHGVVHRVARAFHSTLSLLRGIGPFMDCLAGTCGQRAMLYLFSSAVEYSACQRKFARCRTVLCATYPGSLCADSVRSTSCYKYSEGCRYWLDIGLRICTVNSSAGA